MLVIEVTPVAFADVCLVADDFFAVGEGSVLDAAVDEAGFMVAADAEKAAELEVAVFFSRGEVGVGGYFVLTITRDDHAIDD